MFLSDFRFILPELYLLAIVLFFLPSCLVLDNYLVYKHIKVNTTKFHLYFIIISLVFLICLLFKTFSFSYLIFNNFFYGNLFTALTKTILTLALVTIFISALSYYKDNLIGYEFVFIMLLSLFATFSIVSSYDFITLFFSIELLSLSIYVLTAYKKDSLLSTEAGLRYFILGAFISCVLGFGISLVYYVFGSTNFGVISTLGNLNIDTIYSNNVFFYSYIFIISAFLFKLSAFPYHFWTPDVYQGTSILVTKFLAIIPKIAMSAVLFILLSEVFSYYSYYSFVLLFISGVSSIIIGTIGGLYQIKIKRLLAYSTIANMGYVLIAFSLHSFSGYQSGLLYVYIYVLVNIVLFAILISNVNLKGRTFQNLSELSKLNVNPVQAIIFSVSLFSLAGVPPLAGFYGKFYLLYPLISNGFFYVSIFLIILSIISAGYYMRLIKLVFFDNMDSFAFIRSQTRATIYMIVVGFIINIGFLLIAKQVLFTVELAVKSVLL